MSQLFIAMFFTLLAFGCNNDPWKVATYTTVGKLTINGTVPEYALIKLVPIGIEPDVRGSCPYGLVGKDGLYQLSTYKTNDGAPVGEYAVTISWPQDLRKPETDRLSGKFSQVKDAPVVFKVEAKRNEIPTIELKCKVKDI